MCWKKYLPGIFAKLKQSTADHVQCMSLANLVQLHRHQGDVICLDKRDNSLCYGSHRLFKFAIAMVRHHLFDVQCNCARTSQRSMRWMPAQWVGKASVGNVLRTTQALCQILKTGRDPDCSEAWAAQRGTCARIWCGSFEPVIQDGAPLSDQGMLSLSRVRKIDPSAHRHLRVHHCLPGEASQSLLDPTHLSVRVRSPIH